MAADPEPPRRFVGRDETVAALREQLDDVLSGRGGVTILLGESGVGKSALLDELADTVRRRGFPLLMARAEAVDDPLPFSLIREALGSGQVGSPPVSERPASGAPEAGRRGLDAQGPSGGTTETEDFESRLLRTLENAEDRGLVSRDRVFQQITDAVLELARGRPAVLFFDDLHRADESSLAALEYLANRLRARPMWILGSSRSFASLTEAKFSRIESFHRSTGATEILLRPMKEAEVATYLALIEPGKKFTPLEVARILAESRGNPRLIQHTLHRLASSHVVRDRSETALSPLNQDAAQVLGVAAVLGPSFSFDLLQGASGLDRSRLVEVIDHLVNRGVLFERPDDLFEFPEDRLREEQYGRLTENQLRAIHLRAGKAREATESSDSSRVFGLARDFYLGRDDQKSLEYNRIAAEIAERASAPDIARSFLARALQNQRNLDPEDRESEALQVLELARVTYEMGRLKEAESTLQGFLDRTKDDTDLSPRLRASNELLLAQTLTAQGNLRGSAEIIGRVLGSGGLASEPLLLIGAHHQLGLILYYQGRYTDALAEHTAELRLSEKVHNDRLATHARKWRAADLMMIGQVDEALSEAREVAATLDRLGSAGESAQGHLFLGNLLADTKSNPDLRREAIQELGKAIQLGEEARDPRRVGWAHYFTAEILLAEKRLPQAAQSAASAYEILGRVGDKVGQGVSAKVIAQVAMANGSLDVAESSLREAERLLEGSDHKLEEIDVGLRTAQLYALRGDRSRALAKAADLERRGLRIVRPDLAAEFDELRKSIATDASPSR